ncbi:MAG TPA: recombination regulator RecX [Burkholderiales bacterium]|nr:recombination regulator RecX [Burkholderiales bacterium]
MSVVEPSRPPSKKPEPDRSRPSVRVRALQFLARREYTRAELKARLEGEGADAAEVETVLEEFSKSGWISDTRVIEQVAHTRRSRFGSSRIRQELLAKGVPDHLVEAAMPQLKEGDIEAARAIWRKKFGEAPGNAADRARQLRFLQSRGFSLDVAMRVVREAADQSQDRGSRIED